MPTPRPRPRILRRRSTLHGHGVFADQTITKNTRIIDYAGELIRNRDSAAREIKYLEDGCIWVFRIGRGWSRDAGVGGNLARFINHACKPNCWIELDVKNLMIWIRASRNIRKGDELTYDYQTVGDHTIQCRCRPGCRTKL
ncbi:MAG: SET domain-containing protein-lysine N-methyltransferase [Vicinamibacterales bacterium]